MYTAPTLTREEFRELHKGLCSLRHIPEQLADILHPDLVARCSRAIAQIDKGLERAYAEEETAGEALRNYFDALRTKHGLRSIWSEYDIGPGGIEQVAYPGNWTLLYDASHPAERGIVLQDPTWLDLWKASEKLIAESGDWHHMFIEGFVRRDQVLVLSLGS